MKPNLTLLCAGLLCGCAPKTDLPPGYECMAMQDGYYLRSNGVALMKQRYATRDEAKGHAYLMASAPTDQNHIKLDAVVDVSFATNDDHQVHRFVWISFNVQGFPFRGLLSDQVVGETPTNTPTLLSK